MKTITKLLASTLIAGTVAVGSTVASAAEITVGLVAGLSGGGAQIGQWMVQGAETAIERINAQGEETTFKLVAEDTQWNAQKTVEAFNKLVSVDGASIILVGGSSPLQAVAPLADQQDIILFNIGAQSPAVAGIGRNVFHALQLSDVDIGVMAKYAHDELGLRKLGVMYVNNDTGKFTQAEFVDKFKAAGGEVVAQEAFNQNDSNFGVQLAKLSAAKPDSVYLVGTPAELPFAVKQARQIIPDVNIVSYAGIESQELLDAAGDAANGIVYSTTYFDPKSDAEQVRMFVGEYMERYGGEPVSPYITYTYDAMTILARALSKTGGEAGTALRDKILDIRTFPVITGDTVFRDDGTVVKAIAIKEIRDGAFALRKVIDPQ